MSAPGRRRTERILELLITVAALNKLGARGAETG